MTETHRTFTRLGLSVTKESGWYRSQSAFFGFKSPQYKVSSPDGQLIDYQNAPTAWLAALIARYYHKIPKRR